MFQYKGFVGVCTYDDEVKIYHGECVGDKYVITFQGDSLQEAEEEFKKSVDVYLDWIKTD